MTRREQLEAYLDMFTHEGWKSMVLEAEDAISLLNTLDGVNSESQLSYRKGELSRLRQLAGFETQVRAELDEMDEEARTREWDG